jgi:hypothetical protein
MKEGSLRMHIAEEEEEEEELIETGAYGQSWRIVLFRSVRDGQLDIMKQVVSSHPEAIHEKFTSGMKDWELQWDSLRWYEFGESSCLYIASAYSQKNVVVWLLANGADPNTKNYSSQTAIEVVGQCNYNKEAADEIVRLLKLPRDPPQPPNIPETSCKIGFEDQLITIFEESPNHEDPDGPMIRRPKRVTERVVRCKIIADWRYASLSLSFSLSFRSPFFLFPYLTFFSAVFFFSFLPRAIYLLLTGATGCRLKHISSFDFEREKGRRRMM